MSFEQRTNDQMAKAVMNEWRKYCIKVAKRRKRVKLFKTKMLIFYCNYLKNKYFQAFKHYKNALVTGYYQREKYHQLIHQFKQQKARRAFKNWLIFLKRRQKEEKLRRKQQRVWFEKIIVAYECTVKKRKALAKLALEHEAQQLQTFAQAQNIRKENKSPNPQISQWIQEKKQQRLQPKVRDGGPKVKVEVEQVKMFQSDLSDLSENRDKYEDKMKILTDKLQIKLNEYEFLKSKPEQDKLKKYKDQLKKQIKDILGDIEQLKTNT